MYIYICMYISGVFPSIFYCCCLVVKTQSPIFFISVTHISLQLSCNCIFQQSSRFQTAKFLLSFMGHHGGTLSVTNQNKQ